MVSISPRSRSARTAAGVVAVLVCGVAAPAENPGTARIGTKLPDFDAATLGGEQLSLAATLAGQKAVVVVFLSTVCPYARLFAGHIRELEEHYGPRGVRFIGVNSNGWESKDEVAADARKRGFLFPFVKDESHEIARLLGARATPEAFVIDAGRRLRYRGWVKSRQESPDLQRAIDDVVSGRRVRRPETKAFGCAIDRG